MDLDQSGTQKSGPTTLHLDYREALNDQQYAAVSATGPEGGLESGPVLVIAGAGSGKTRTLTYRVAWLVEHGVAPWRILLLTFTNKAAKEMLRRVAELLPHDTSTVWGGTFHHVCHRILRRHAELAGLGADFTIMDRDDAVDMINACIGQAKIDTKQTEFPKGAVLAEIFSFAINTGQPLPVVVENDYDYLEPHLADIERVLALYTENKQTANAVDFDDLLVRTLNLFDAQPEVLARYQEQFEHVLVDEYQDTNPIQSALVESLSGRRRNVMVVGDDAQSIYSWRGADFRNILGFPKRYPDARIFRVEVNYRSVPGILSLANAVIAHNRHQFEKKLRPMRNGKAMPALVRCPDSRHQAQFVAQQTEEWHRAGVPYSEMAVLYRAHYHAMELQLELTERGIPHRVTSGLRFFEQAHVKDVCSFLRVAANGRDEVAFRRMAMMLDGVGAKSAMKMWAELKPVWQEGQPAPVACGGVPKKAAHSWERMANLLNTLRSPTDRPAPSQMVSLVVEDFYEEYAQARFPNARQRLEDIHALAEFAEAYESPDEFLSQLALMTNLEAEESGAGRAGEEDAMRLSTVHQAKGLEWRVVFVIGLCDGMFPLSRVIREDTTGEALEEERRLFYVAVTRARDELYLLYPEYREQGAMSGFQLVSRFVQEIPVGLRRELKVKHQPRRWL